MCLAGGMIRALRQVLITVLRIVHRDLTSILSVLDFAGLLHVMRVSGPVASSRLLRHDAWQQWHNTARHRRGRAA